MKTILALLLAVLALAGTASSNTVGIGPTLPATCVAGNPPDTWTVDGPPPTGYVCLGVNTWVPDGHSPILGIVKGISLATANVDFAVTLKASVRYVPRKILVTGATVSLSGSPVRVGVWTAAGGTGTNIVPASALTTLLTPTSWAEANLTTTNTSMLATVFVRVTVAHTAPVSVDIYFYGDTLP